MRPRARSRVGAEQKSTRRKKSVSRSKACVVIGAGGHARMIIEALELSQIAIPKFLLDRDESIWGTKLLGVPILGGDELLTSLHKRGVKYFMVGLGGVRDNFPRKQVFEAACKAGLEPLSLVHPTAHSSSHAILGAGTFVGPMAVVNAGASIGLNVIVNSGAIIEHDCVIGDHTHVATGARLSSTVKVAPLAHVGAGATVRQCISIGFSAVVGAGAVVIRDVPEHAVVAGVPARPIHHGSDGVQ